MGANVISFRFGGVTPPTANVSLVENQAAVVQAANDEYYWIRCLPHDFPKLQISGSASGDPGWYLTGNMTQATNGGSNTYTMVLDSNGTPVWYRAAPGGAINVEALPDDTIAWMGPPGAGFGLNPAVGYNLYNLDTQTNQTLMAAIGPTDPHELYPMPNGDYMMIGTPITQLATPFDGYNAIVDCVVQEVTGQGNLVWSWRASDHINLAEDIHPASAIVRGQTVLDAFHCNSIDVDPTSGQVLVSMRYASAVYLIQRVSAVGALVQNGPIIWKLKGCGNSLVGPDNEPVLDVENDPEGCFDGQHDARFEPHGDISVYDDHTFQESGGARGVEYSIDTQNSTARWVRQYPTLPSGEKAGATGSFRIYANGNDNLVGWGFRPGSGFTETDAVGNPFFSMTYPDGELEYRVVKVPLNALSINSLRATAGLPTPISPTVGWGSLGGGLSSKPAVASSSANHLDVFMRGTDGQLWLISWDAGGWGAWVPLGGQLYPGTGPAVASDEPGRLDVFVEGTDRQLWHTWYDSTGLHSWQPLGGVLASGPAAASWGPGRLDIVVEGTDRSVYHKWYEAGSWSGWESLGSQTTADPGVASWAAGRLDVFVKGTDNQLWHAWYTSGAWYGWEHLGGTLTTGPSATSLGDGLVDVGAAGPGGQPERLAYNSGWQTWQPLGGTTLQPPAIVAFQGGEYMFATGTDNALWVLSVPLVGANTSRPTCPVATGSILACRTGQ